MAAVGIDETGTEIGQAQGTGGGVGIAEQVRADDAAVAAPTVREGIEPLRKTVEGAGVFWEMLAHEGIERLGIAGAEPIGEGPNRKRAMPRRAVWVEVVELAMVVVDEARPVHEEIEKALALGAVGSPDGQELVGPESEEGSAEGGVGRALMGGGAFAIGRGGARGRGGSGADVLLPVARGFGGIVSQSCQEGKLVIWGPGGGTAAAGDGEEMLEQAERAVGRGSGNALLERNHQRHIVPSSGRS